MYFTAYVHSVGVLKTQSQDSWSPDCVVLTYQPQHLTPEQGLYFAMIFRQSNLWNGALYGEGGGATYMTAVTELVVSMTKLTSYQAQTSLGVYSVAFAL